VVVLESNVVMVLISDMILAWTLGNWTLIARGRG